MDDDDDGEPLPDTAIDYGDSFRPASANSLLKFATHTPHSHQRPPHRRPDGLEEGQEPDDDNKIAERDEDDDDDDEEAIENDDSLAYDDDYAYDDQSVDEHTRLRNPVPYHHVKKIINR